MAQRVDIPLGPVPPGLYAHDILAPARSDSAKLTLTRQPLGWPVGALFTYRVYERERAGSSASLARLEKLNAMNEEPTVFNRAAAAAAINTLDLITSGTESGGPSIGKDGTVNPPFVVTIKWGADKDRDLLRFELDVLQLFTTAITVEFL